MTGRGPVHCDVQLLLGRLKRQVVINHVVTHVKALDRC